jgi:hypothetical protein
MTTTLTFGKFKGQRFCDTPKWYQQWLNKQDWFTAFMSANLSVNVKPTDNGKALHKKLSGWNGYNAKGQAIYDQIFQQEMDEADKYDPSDRYGHYEGI